MNEATLGITDNTKQMMFKLNDDEMDLFSITVAECIQKIMNNIIYEECNDQTIHYLQEEIHVLTNDLKNMNLPAINFEFAYDDNGKCVIKITELISSRILTASVGNISIPFESWEQKDQFIDKLHEYGYF